MRLHKAASAPREPDVSQGEWRGFWLSLLLLCFSAKANMKLWEVLLPGTTISKRCLLPGKIGSEPLTTSCLSKIMPLDTNTKASRLLFLIPDLHVQRLSLLNCSLHVTITRARLRKGSTPKSMQNENVLYHLSAKQQWTIPWVWQVTVQV